MILVPFILQYVALDRNLHHLTMCNVRIKGTKINLSCINVIKSVSYEVLKKRLQVNSLRELVFLVCKGSLHTLPNIIRAFYGHTRKHFVYQTLVLQLSNFVSTDHSTQ